MRSDFEYEICKRSVKEKLSRFGLDKSKILEDVRVYENISKKFRAEVSILDTECNIRTFGTRLANRVGSRITEVRYHSCTLLKDFEKLT